MTSYYHQETLHKSLSVMVAYTDAVLTRLFFHEACTLRKSLHKIAQSKRLCMKYLVNATNFSLWTIQIARKELNTRPSLFAGGLK